MPPQLPRRLAAGTAAAALCLVLLSAAPLAVAECQISLSLDPQSSRLSLGGGVVAPLEQPLQPMRPETALGLQGSLAAVSTGACPGDAAELAAGLASVRLQTTAGLGSLMLYPDSIQAAAGSLAAVEISGVAVNLTTAPLVPTGSPAGDTWQYSATISATLAAGAAIVNASLLSSEPVPVDLAGLSASNTTQVFASAQGGLAQVELRGFRLAFPYTLTVAGSPLEVALEVVLNGSLALQAALGCPQDCGPHGRCWLASGSGTDQAQAVQAAPACECECGWAGDSCAIPSGFCPQYPSHSLAASTCPAAPAPSPATVPASPLQEQCPPCVTPAECSPRQEYDPATRQCVCLPDWEGALCSSCQAGAACDAFYGVSGATCSSGDFRFQQQSQFKVYTCELQGGLDSVLRPAFTVSCNTSRPDPGDEASGRYCQLDMTLAEGGAMTCRMYRCAFHAGSTRVDCQTTRCECAGSCPAFQPLAEMATGQPAVLDCDPSTNLCNTDIKDFIVKSVIANCTSAECLVDTYSLEEGSYSAPSQDNSNVVIAAVPLMLLVAVACAFAALLARHWRYWTAIGRHGPQAEASAGACGGRACSAEAADKLGAASSAPFAEVALQAGGPMEELRFEHLCCTVPARRGAKGSTHGTPSKAVPISASATKETSPGASSRLGCGLWRRPGGGSSHSSARDSREMKAVLRGVSGVARRGELVGVMGPSGCGKTSLLALICQSSEYISSGAEVEGAVLLDGVPLGAAGRHKLAFVPQDDSLPSTLTVAECLTEHAMLRLPTQLTPEQIQAQVWRVIGELGLQHVAGSRVGSPSGGGRGISGGERRRVTIGQELVANPAILVLDEPTSGLDAHSALQLMKTLKQVASAGRIVLLSCHQPSPAMFALMNRSYLLVAGACVYGGPPAAVASHFAALGLPCPPDSSVAEHMLEVVSNPQQLERLLASVHTASKLGSSTEEVAAQKAATAAAASMGPPTDRYAGDPLSCNSTDFSPVAPVAGEDVLQTCARSGTGTGATIDGAAAPPLGPSSCGSLANDMITVPAAAATAIEARPAWGQLSPSEGAEEADGSACSAASSAAPACRPASRLGRELAVVVGRTLADTLRNPSLLLMHWLLALAMGLLMGAVFWQVGNDMSGIQNRGGGVYFSLAFFSFTALTITDLLLAERCLVAREVRGGYCRPTSYLLAKVVLDGLLLRVVPVIIYSLPFYYMMGLQTGASHVALFLFTVCTFALAVAAMSLAVTIGCSTAGKASLVLTFIFLVSLLVGGFLVNVDSIPSWIRWLRFLSLFFYSYGILTTNEVQDLRMDFTVKGYTAVSNVNGGAVLDTFGIDAESMTTWIIVLNCFYAALLLLAFFMLHFRLRAPKALHERAMRRGRGAATEAAAAADGAVSLV